MKGMFLSDNITSITDNANTIAGTVADKGFIIAFTSVMMVIVCAFFVWLFSTVRKKSDKELDILSKERSASIEQSNQMFKLVTEVQTQQVAQLQQMTESLKDLRRSMDDSEHQISTIGNNFDQIKSTILDCEGNHRYIRQTLDEVLTCVQTSKELNSKILSKIDFIEKEIAKAERSSNKKRVGKTPETEVRNETNKKPNVKKKEDE